VGGEVVVQPGLAGLAAGADDDGADAGGLGQLPVVV